MKTEKSISSTLLRAFAKKSISAILKNSTGWIEKPGRRIHLFASPLPKIKVATTKQNEMIRRKTDNLRKIPNGILEITNIDATPKAKEMACFCTKIYGFVKPLTYVTLKMKRRPIALNINTAKTIIEDFITKQNFKK